MANPFANTVKVLTAINLLASPSGTTIRGLMGRLSISRRTAFRLLNALYELGFPLIDEQPKPRNEKTYRLLDSYVLKLPNIAIPNPCLTAEEIIFIIAVLKTCKRLKLSRETRIINSAIEKLSAMMPGQSQ